MKLVGASAFVSGGTSGLAAATVRALAERSSAVVTLSRQGSRAHEQDRRIIHCVGDVCDAEAVTAAIDAALAVAPLRAVVLCAGGGTQRRTVDRSGRLHDLDLLREALETTVIGTFNCARLAAAAMAMQAADEQGARGAIVLTSSLAATAGQVGQVAYAAGKAAIEGMMLPLARDLAPLGFRVNAIRPGGFETPIFDPAVVDGVREKVSAMTVFPHRFGRPDEFAGLALELLTNDYLNAAAVELDAGMRQLPR